MGVFLYIIVYLFPRRCYEPSTDGCDIEDYYDPVSEVYRGYARHRKCAISTPGPSLSASTPPAQLLSFLGVCLC